MSLDAARTSDVVEKVPGQTSRTRFWGYKMVNRIDPIACRAAKRACFFGRSMGEDFFNNVTHACRVETHLDACSDINNNNYCTAIVTVFDMTPPMDITTGTAL